MGCIDRVERLLHFGVNVFLERLGRPLEPRLDHRSILLHGKIRILVEIVHNPALALGDGLRAELVARQLVAPIAERALRKFLDVALVNQRHALALVVERVADGAPHQPFRSRRRDRFDPHAGVPADLLVGALEHAVVQEFEQLLGFGRAGFPLDAHVHVFRVLAEDHHIHLFWISHGRGNSRVVAHRPHARIQIQDLAQRHVERSNPAAHRRRQRALDADQIRAKRVDRFVGQPVVEPLEALFARVDFLPRDRALATVGEVQILAHRAKRAVSSIEAAGRFCLSQPRARDHVDSAC